jgi:hypothetical protein
MAAGAVAGAVSKKRAADKAAAAQKKGIKQQQNLLNTKLDPKVLNRLAQEADAERAKGRLALQKEIDPELAALRQVSKDQLLAQANISEESKQSSQLANQLFQETQAQDPRLEKLKNSILDAAQTEIDAGATLPPEFQAELVRSGLNQGSQAGIAIDRGSIGGGVARALGLAGIQLQQQRQQAAQQLANTGQGLVLARTNVLASVFPKLRDLETQRRLEAGANFGLAEASLPESGLGGQDIANLQVGKTHAQAALLGQTAANKAQQAQNKGAFTSSLIGAGTSLLGGAVSPTATLGGVASSIFGSGSSAPAGTVMSAPSDPTYGTGFNWNKQ